MTARHLAQAARLGRLLARLGERVLEEARGPPNPSGEIRRGSRRGSRADAASGLGREADQRRSSPHEAQPARCGR